MILMYISAPTRGRRRRWMRLHATRNTHATPGRAAACRRRRRRCVICVAGGPKSRQARNNKPSTP